MQAINKQKNKKPYKLIALVVVIAVLLAGGLYVALARPFTAQNSPATTPQVTRPVNSIDYGPPTNQDQKDADAAKQQAITQQQNPQPSSAISVTIARAGQASAGQPLNIRTNVNGATSGSCNATLTNAGQTATGSGTIATSGSAYICSIDIPVASFASSGQWQLSVTITSGSLVSKAAAQTVTITK